MSDKIRLINLVGARPQFIKASAFSRALRNLASDRIEEVLVHSGQHYDENMSDVFFKDLGIPAPTYHLGVRSDRQMVQIANMITALDKVVDEVRPDVLLVYGDTNTTLAGALVASRHGVPLAHVEAGLRSYNNLMPEEHNRKVTDHLSTWLFCPSQVAIDNLRKEGILNRPEASCYVTGVGDIMKDVALYQRERSNSRPSLLSGLEEGSPYVLLTIHRNFNTDKPERLRSILEGVARVADRYPVVFPLHPRTADKIPSDLMELLSETECIITEPQSYPDMIALLRHSSVVITDSGGLQKEAYFFEKPVVIPRSETEWVEAVDHGCAVLVDADGDALVSHTLNAVTAPPSLFPVLYGDGNSAGRMVREILNYFER